MGRFEEERRELVESLRAKGISDEKTLSALMRVERHLFVMDAFINRAYEDTALPISKSQTISQPYTVALMTQALQPKPSDKVLEIGTGSGYQAAILAEMGCRVFTIERHYELYLQARKLLERLNYRVTSRSGDGTIGWSEFAPYDGIVVTAAAPDIPAALLDQLNVGGRLVIPIGDLDTQELSVITKLEDGLNTETISGFKFVPLIGKQGWNSRV